MTDILLKDEDIGMPLHIKDDETAALVSELAEILGMTEQEAVKSAVKAELERLSDGECFADKLRAFYERYPLPPPTGLKADKAFFDQLSGAFD